MIQGKMYGFISTVLLNFYENVSTLVMMLIKMFTGK